MEDMKEVEIRKRIAMLVRDSNLNTFLLWGRVNRRIETGLKAEKLPLPNVKPFIKDSVQKQLISYKKLALNYKISKSCIRAKRHS